MSAILLYYLLLIQYCLVELYSVTVHCKMWYRYSYTIGLHWRMGYIQAQMGIYMQRQGFAEHVTAVGETDVSRL